MITAAYALACALLVYAGAVKLAAADDPMRSRLLGLTEAVVGAAGLSIDNRAIAAAVGLLYAGFAVYVLLAIRRGDPSCGCFGAKERTPPRAAHAAIDAALAVAALGAAVVGSSEGAPVDAAWATPLHGVVYAVFLISATAMAAAALSSGAQA
ncbi:MAG: hypothetical protein QOI20_658 [Acidimicrobiaceae bacterium]|nr:hypothetical protein [Acidimicrobiaceae bacterium]